MALELLDEQQILTAIEQQYLQNLSRIIIFDEIESTNSYLLALAKQNVDSGTACFAESQTNGRGRLGRTWFSPFGVNLYFSLLWRLPETAFDVSSLSIAIAVMVASVLRQYGVLSGIQLKWPNDVLFAGRKLAGILLERNDPRSVVIGIGLNLNVADAGEKQWIDLTEITGQTPRRNFLAGLLLNELLSKLPIYTEQGLRPFLTEWRQHDVLVNQAVLVQTPGKNISGKMCGINERGEMILQDESGQLQTFCYGEVSVRSQAAL